MDTIKFERFNDDALSLFDRAKKFFENSSSVKLKEKATLIPSHFVDKDKKIRIVFAGQYSAGKSSILSILTGKQLEVGQGVTTSTCNYIDWKGIEVVDTPGIHTQKRPDHDEITYNAMSEADLIIFVCTAEGFSEGLGTHFRKLLVEKGKGNEMMLVINKMESSKYGNTKEGQEEFFKCDVLPVISPEYSKEDLFISYIDTYAYQDALEAEGEDCEELLKISGYKEFFKNIDCFIEKKKILGKCTTSLYTLEQMLSEALSEFKTGDICIDGSLELLNQQRKAWVEAKEHINTEAFNIVRRNTQEVRNWGYEIANKLSSSVDASEVNLRLEEKYKATESVYTNAVEELKEVIKFENDNLQRIVSSMENSEFVSSLKSAIEQRIGNIKMNDRTAQKIKGISGKAGEAGQWLSKFATGPNAGNGWNAIFKLGSYSGSNAHQTILKVGHAFGHKFKPWEAVKLSSKVGQFGKILGVAGALAGIVIQIWNDYQEDKMEKQLLAYRSDIRNCFSEAARVIDLQFDNDTQTWIESNIIPQINDIDKEINEIQNYIKGQEKEIEIIYSLLKETRNMISDIQNNFS